MEIICSLQTSARGVFCWFTTFFEEIFINKIISGDIEVVIILGNTMVNTNETHYDGVNCSELSLEVSLKSYSEKLTYDANDHTTTRGMSQNNESRSYDLFPGFLSMLTRIFSDQSKVNSFRVNQVSTRNELERLTERDSKQIKANVSRAVAEINFGEYDSLNKYYVGLYN